LLVKQNLFDGVLSEGNTTNYVDFSTKGRSQFIQQIEAFVTQQENGINAEKELPDIEAVTETTPTDATDIEQLETIEELNFEQKEKPAPAPTQATPIEVKQTAEMEQVMNNGMQFLAGLFKMSTGKDLGLDSQKIEIDAATGEVVMRFKMKM
jgi:hypothetical protein